MKDNHRIRISCIIPTHARPKDLRTALECVASQQLQPTEALVVIDTDDPETEEVVSEFAARGLPVQLIENRLHPGASGSRNLGASRSKGEILAFLDDDDVWDPVYLATAARPFSSDQADMVITGIRRVRPDGNVRQMIMPGRVEPEKWFDRNPGLTGSNVVLRRAVFDQVGGFDPALPVMNDWDFLVRALSAGVRYVVVEDPLVEWREHNGERISSLNERRALGIEAFIVKHGNSMSEHQRNVLASQAVGIRRRHARSGLERLYHSMTLLRLLGPSEAIRRRIRPMIGPR